MNLSLRFSRAMQEHQLARSHNAARGDGPASGTTALRP